MSVVGPCKSQWSMSPNAAVLVGSKATLTCQTDARRVCFTYKVNIFDRDIIDVCDIELDDKFIDRCKVTKKNAEGIYTLTISDVQLSDAGLFSCGDCYTTEATTHLLLLGKMS